jgi:arylformamidase
MNQNWIDISVAITPAITTWPSDPTFEHKKFAAFEWGAPCDASQISLSVHTGTHIDAPAHFIQGGDTVGKWNPTDTMGPCRVVEIGHPLFITKDELMQKNILPRERILFKTQNSKHTWWLHPFNPQFVHFSEEGAEYLASLKPACIGIDYLSVGGPENGPEVHRHLLGAGIWIVESLNLCDIEPNEYDFIFMPINLYEAEGAPGRALLSKK